MSLTDPVADLLARIRNSINARHQKLDVPASKLKLEIARILKEEGRGRQKGPAHLSEIWE
jgi:small subunit ribosomal protein S8